MAGASICMSHSVVLRSSVLIGFWFDMFLIATLANPVLVKATMDGLRCISISRLEGIRIGLNKHKAHHITIR